jgi:hypothetical protein
VACLVSYDAIINKNGRRVSQNVVHHFNFKGDEQVVRWRAWEDTARTLAAWNAQSRVMVISRQNYGAPSSG